MPPFPRQNFFDDPPNSNCTLEDEVRQFVPTASDDSPSKPEKTCGTSTGKSLSQRIGMEHAQYTSLDPSPAGSEAKLLDHAISNATSSITQYLVRNWLLELGVAIVCLLGTSPFYFVLRTYDTQPLSAWRFTIQVPSSPSCNDNS